MCLHEAVTVHDCRVVLAHRGISRGWHTFAAARIFGRGALNSSYRLADRLTHRLADRLAYWSIVPSLALVLARGSRNFLRAPSWIGRMSL